MNFDFEAEKSVLEERVRQLLELYANIDLDIDKKVFVAMLKEYAAVVGPVSRWLPYKYNNYQTKGQHFFAIFLIFSVKTHFIMSIY